MFRMNRKDRLDLEALKVFLSLISEGGGKKQCFQHNFLLWREVCSDPSGVRSLLESFPFVLMPCLVAFVHE